MSERKKTSGKQMPSVAYGKDGKCDIWGGVGVRERKKTSEKQMPSVGYGKDGKCDMWGRMGVRERKKTTENKCRVWDMGRMGSVTCGEEWV